MAGMTRRQPSFGSASSRCARAERPHANVDAAVALIGEGQARRRGLCADAGNDQHHGGESATRCSRRSSRKSRTRRSPRFREVARGHRLWLQSVRWRSRTSPDRAANRWLPDRPPRRHHRALRQDPHVRRRSGEWRELPRIAQLSRRASIAVVADLPWGRLGVTICYDLRFPALYRALAEAGSVVSRDSVAFTRQTGEAHWHMLLPRPRDRERLLRVRRGAGRQARERPRDLRPFDRDRSVGPHSRRRRHRARRRHAPTSIRPRSRRRARAFPRSSTAAGSKMIEPMAEPAHLHAVRGAE